MLGIDKVPHSSALWRAHGINLALPLHQRCYSIVGPWSSTRPSQRTGYPSSAFPQLNPQQNNKAKQQTIESQILLYICTYVSTRLGKKALCLSSTEKRSSNEDLANSITGYIFGDTDLSWFYFSCSLCLCLTVSLCLFFHTPSSFGNSSFNPDSFKMICHPSHLPFPFRCIISGPFT